MNFNHAQPLNDKLYNRIDKNYYDVINIASVTRYNTVMKRYELKQGYVYENEIGHNKQWAISNS